MGKPTKKGGGGGAGGAKKGAVVGGGERSLVNNIKDVQHISRLVCMGMGGQTDSIMRVEKNYATKVRDKVFHLVRKHGMDSEVC